MVPTLFRIYGKAMLVQKHSIKDSGQYKTHISLVDNNSLPVSPFSVIFLDSWIKQDSANTKLRYAYELRFFLLFLRSISPEVDIESRVRAGEFLTSLECDKFIQACNFIQESISNSGNVIPIERFSDKALQNAIHSSKISKGKVKASTSNGRIKTAVMFLECVYENIHGRFHAPVDVKNNFKALERQLRLAKKSLGDGNPKEPQFEISVIPEDKYLELLEIIQPDSDKNPFKHSKLRNYLVILLILETGLRRAGIAKLKISDCMFHGSGDQIRVTKTPDDPDDRRIDKPSQKTLAHSSYVPVELMKILDEYIKNQRARFPTANNHEFVFVSEMSTKGIAGDPLSLNSINYIFSILSKALKFNISPHTGRHKWNELFTEATEGMDENEISKLRKYAMGWSKNSEMEAVYNAFKLSVAVRGIRKKRQEEIDETENDDNEK
ncbi:MAG: integrase [Colwellia sp.]|jgi:integrase